MFFYSIQSILIFEYFFEHFTVSDFKGFLRKDQILTQDNIWVVHLTLCIYHYSNYNKLNNKKLSNI